MSLNQSRGAEKSDTQFRKPGGGGRSGAAHSGGPHHRPFSGGRGRGGAGPTNPHHHHPAAPPSSSTTRYKKVNNAQGGQSRGNFGPVNTPDPSAVAGARSVENGGHVQSTLHGVSSTAAPPALPKPADISSQKTNRPLPKAPSSQSSSNSDATLPSTPAKGDGGKGFSLQFGSISPGFMNGMQVPARTSSAPPNLDEQKRDQARRDASRAVPAVPLPLAPKQELSKKDVGLPDKPVTQEIHTESKAKRDAQVATASPPSQAQKPSSVPISGISMALPFHQPTIPMQFGGPNSQIQSQGMPASSLQMPIQMPLQMGTPSQVPQQVFVPGLQHPLMQSQGIMHQGQNLSYNPQLGPQLPHQLGNLGINMSSQFNQQQSGKFGSGRKTVKITHPDTHEELRLDSRDAGSSGSRPHHNAAPQNQPLPTYTAAHSMGYYSNSYTTGPPFFPAQGSLPLTSTQLNASSQGTKFSYPVSQAQSNMSFVNPSTNFPVTKIGASMHGTPDSSSNADYVRDVHNTVPSIKPSSTPVTVKAAGEKVLSSSTVESSKLLNPALEPGVAKKDPELNLQSKSSVGHSNQSVPVSASVAAETSIAATSSSVPRELAPIPTHTDPIKQETVIKSTSIEDNHKQPGNKGNPKILQQVDRQSDSEALQNLGEASKAVVLESAEPKIIRTSSGLKEGALEADRVSPIVSDASVSDVKQNETAMQEKITRESAVAIGRGVKEQLGGLQPDKFVKGADTVKVIDHDGNFEKAALLESVTEASQRKAESATSVTEGDDIQNIATTTECDSLTVSDDSNTSSSIVDSVSCKDYDISKSSMSDNEVPVSVNILEANAGLEKDVMENPRPSSSSGSSKASMEASKSKNKGKKKLKEMLQKADALGTTADLYMAYKGPEEKKETVAAELMSEDNLKELSSGPNLEESVGKNQDEQSKIELDDWEDAADISTPKLESSGIGRCGSSLQDEEGVTAKKYSRDFLLTFSDQCTDLPEGFEITADVATSLMSDSVNASHTNHDYPSPGRNIDRQGGSTRPDRRGNGMMDAERWSKQPGPYPPARDPGMDYGFGGPGMAYSGGRGAVLRNPRAQGPVQHPGGILSGPMHSLGIQGPPRNNSDADRWQRGTNFNRGLMPAPYAPSPVMHRAERKYEVGKVTDEEQAKQRKLKGILNKLTPQNFEKLFEQVKEVHIDNVITLTGVISQIFDKALMEPTFCEMYANFCQHLASALPDLSVDNEKITFRRLLLNKCQEEFERGEREEQEANNADGEGDTELSEAEREDKRLKVRRRMLGNIRLIGELYKKRMLTERIMHECIKKLLGQYQNPDEENIEALCKLMSTIGEMIDHPKAKEHMDAYFDIMGQLSNNMKLSSRLRFMLKDSIDLRKNKWQQRRKVEGPKKIDEVHRDIAHERQQVGRLSRGPSMNAAVRRGQPLDFGQRGPMLSSPIGAAGGFRGVAPQVRGFGGQDTRMDERNTFESRTSFSVPLPQRSSADTPITLGPQGGLARGMAFRGQPSASSSLILDNSAPYGDPRRTAGGLNGYGAASERGVYSARESPLMRNMSDRFSPSVPYDQSSSHELNASYNNREFGYPDRNFDRSRPITPPVARAGVSPAYNNTSEKALPVERLRDMSMAAIREYYSAKDDKEVALCIKDLNAPSYYPTVVSNWVSDSFERKDMERDLLANLLVTLTKPRDGTFTPTQLIQGFKSVLTDLEDTVTDAPKAPEFLGRIFAKVVVENVLPLKDVGQLIQHGAEEPGRLLEVGLAADVLGSVLEMIKSEKGESVLNEIRASANLRLEDFRPPDPIRSRKLEMFM